MRVSKSMYRVIKWGVKEERNIKRKKKGPKRGTGVMILRLSFLWGEWCCLYLHSLFSLCYSSPTSTLTHMKKIHSHLNVPSYLYIHLLLSFSILSLWNIKLLFFCFYYELGGTNYLLQFYTHHIWQEKHM